MTDDLLGKQKNGKDNNKSYPPRDAVVATATLFGTFELVSTTVVLTKRPQATKESLGSKSIRSKLNLAKLAPLGIAPACVIDHWPNSAGSVKS